LKDILSIQLGSVLFVQNKKTKNNKNRRDKIKRYTIVFNNDIQDKIIVFVFYLVIIDKTK
jgi:hypothetical protein